MKLFIIGMFIGIVLSVIVFGVVSPIVMDKLLDNKTVGTINRITDTDGVTYMSAAFTNEGIKRMDSEKKVVFNVSPISSIAEKSSSITDTRKTHK